MGGNLRLSREFIEWFRGIVDSEGYFGITKGSGNSYKFMFRMDLHIDDAPALEYIKTTFPLPPKGGGEWVWDLFITFLAIGRLLQNPLYLPYFHDLIFPLYWLFFLSIV